LPGFCPRTSVWRPRNSRSSSSSSTSTANYESSHPRARRASAQPLWNREAVCLLRRHWQRQHLKGWTSLASKRRARGPEALGHGYIE
jgi:hypothetical protein